LRSGCNDLLSANLSTPSRYPASNPTETKDDLIQVHVSKVTIHLFGVTTLLRQIGDPERRVFGARGLTCAAVAMVLLLERPSHQIATDLLSANLSTPSRYPASNPTETKDCCAKSETLRGGCLAREDLLAQRLQWFCYARCTMHNMHNSGVLSGSPIWRNRVVTPNIEIFLLERPSHQIATDLLSFETCTWIKSSFVSVGFEAG
jgi:hypothetical protein